MYTPSALTCPGSLVWAADILPDGRAECPYCQTALDLDPGDKSGTLPAHDAADDRLPIPAADLPDLIAETQADGETREDPFEQNVTNHVLARLIEMWRTAPGCVDRDHGIQDHPCDEVLGRDKAAAIRYAAQAEDDAFDAAREFDRTHPGYWEWRPGVDDQ